MIDKKDCSAVTFEVLELSASWHHRMVLNVLLKGERKFDALIWKDTHAAAGDVRKVNAKDDPAMCVAPAAPPAPVATSTACTLEAGFADTLAPGASGGEVVRLQDLLRCLGFFPVDVDSTGLYGLVTTGAVRQFQASRGILPTTGAVGQRTRAALGTYVR